MTSAALASPLPGRSLSDIPFDSTAGVQMRYRSTSPFTEQDEIVMFSRDTEEMYQSVTTTLVQYAQSNSLAYQVQILPNTLPSAATYSYPPSSGFPSFTFVGEMLTTPAFFGTFAPAGAAAEPDGSGSIKAVRVVQHGRCSHEYKYVNPAPTPTEPSVLDTFIDRFVTALNDNVHQVVSSSTVNFSFREQLGFQHETEDREDSQWGGFWWFAKASPSDGGLIRFNVPYFPYLLDGRVSLLPTVSALFLSGTNAAITSPILGSLEGGQLQLVDRAYERIQTPLRSSQVANQLFDDLQADTVTPAPTTCTMRIAGTGQRSRTIVGPALPGPDQCGTWLSTTVIPQFTASISTVTPPLTAAERTRALENFRLATETADIDGATVFKNFRCNPNLPDGTPVNPADSTQGVCEVVARAKRINTYPDGIELVYFDDEHEVTADSYGLWLVRGGDTDNTGGPPNPLCARRPDGSGMLHTRPYAGTSRGSP